MEYKINLKDIKERIFKGEDGWNNYMNVSIEEMDWLVKQAEKTEQIKVLAHNFKDGYVGEMTDSFLIDEILDILNQ